MRSKVTIGNKWVCVHWSVNVGPFVFQQRDAHVCPKRFPPAEGLQSFQLEQFVVWRLVSHLKVTSRSTPGTIYASVTILPVCPAVVDFLEQNVLPLLKDKLRRKMSEEAEQRAEQSNLAYLMSDIFSDEDEDGFTEVDNS